MKIKTPATTLITLGKDGIIIFKPAKKSPNAKTLPGCNQFLFNSYHLLNSFIFYPILFKILSSFKRPKTIPVKTMKNNITKVILLLPITASNFFQPIQMKNAKLIVKNTPNQ